MTTEEMQKQIESMMPTPTQIVESIDKKLEEKREQIVQVMDYEKKYKEALRWMQSLYNGLHGATKEDAEHYFPELKESEDEKIRKELINVFSNREKYLIDQSFGDITVSEALAWLEKQGEQK